jgi:hypothetical protein
MLAARPSQRTAASTLAAQSAVGGSHPHASQRVQRERSVLVCERLSVEQFVITPEPGGPSLPEQPAAMVKSK